MDISQPRPSLVSLVKVLLQWACRKLQQCLKRKEPRAEVARQDSHDLHILQYASAKELTKITDHWCGSNEHPQRPRFYPAAIGHTTAARSSAERPPVEQPSIAQSSNRQLSVQNPSVEALPVQALPLECPIFEHPVVQGPPITDPTERSAVTDVPSMAPRHPSIRISQFSIDFESVLQTPNMEELQHGNPYTTNRRAVSMDTPLISQKDRRKFLRNARLLLRQNSGLNFDAENTPSLDSNSSSISDTPSVIRTLSRPQSRSSVSSFSSLRLVEWGQRTLYDIRSLGIRGAATL